jgi:hypothetical protein
MAMVSVASIGQTVGFAGQQTFPAGTNPFELASADLNCDGARDLVFALDNDSFSVLLNATAGGSDTVSFGPQQTIITSATFVNGITVGDVNGDGKPDVLLMNGYDRTIAIFIGTTACGASAATFATEQLIPLQSNPSGFATADVNGDGKLDLVVSDGGDHSVSVLLNTTAPGTSTASFVQQQDFPAGMDLGSLSIADINSDGKPDVVVTNPNGNTVSVLLNFTAAGASQANFSASYSFAVGNLPGAVSTADVNGDGKLDLVIVNGLDNSVSVLLNTTAPGVTVPSFRAQQVFLTGLGPSAPAVADVNGDGKPDVVVSAYGGNFVSVLLNTTAEGAATPSFADQQIFATGTNPYFAAIVDINRDGKPDLVVANYTDSTASVLLNITTPWDRILVDGFD